MIKKTELHILLTNFPIFDIIIACIIFGSSNQSLMKSFSLALITITNTGSTECITFHTFQKRTVKLTANIYNLSTHKKKNQSITQDLNLNEESKSKTVIHDRLVLQTWFEEGSGWHLAELQQTLEQWQSNLAWNWNCPDD